MKINKYLYSTILFFLISFVSPVKSDSMFDLGKEVFLNTANCAACHTLADASSNGQIGPNLDEIKPEMARVLNAVTMGIGVMPAYESILTEEEIESVSYYVFKSTNK
tara:strand:- start:76 stop:396 length:321 start_codon:yes stop_codon:yes gene_type:complete